MKLHEWMSSRVHIRSTCCTFPSATAFFIVWQFILRYVYHLFNCLNIHSHEIIHNGSRVLVHVHFLFFDLLFDLPLNDVIALDLIDRVGLIRFDDLIALFVFGVVERLAHFVFFELK